MSVRFDPRSRIMNFVRSACPPRSISRLRACWGPARGSWDGSFSVSPAQGPINTSHLVRVDHQGHLGSRVRRGRPVPVLEVRGHWRGRIRKPHSYI
jgi:hypothetical protein